MTSHRTILPWLACLTLAAGCAAATKHEHEGGPSDEPSSDDTPRRDPDDPITNGLAITSPTDGAVVGSSSVRVEGETSFADGTVVRVGDVETTVWAGKFAVPMELEEGTHRIEATAKDESDAVEFRVDATPPELVIDSPEQAAFVEGETLRITGRVVDETETTVMIGEEVVSVREDGHFAFEEDVQPGAHRRRIVAMDAAGHTDHTFRTALLGDFATPGAPTRNAVAVELGPDALAELGRGVAARLSRVDLEAIVEERNPVSSGWWGELNVVGVSHAGFGVDIEPRSGRIVPRVTVEDLHVDVEIDWSVGGTSSGYITADPELVATANPGVRDGRPEIELGAISVHLHDFRFDVEWVPSWFEDWDAVRSRARSYLEDRLRGLAQEHLPPKLESALSGLPTGRRVSFGAGSFDVGVDLAALDADTGGLWAAVDISATAAGRPTEEAFGPLVTGADAPPYREPEDVAVHVSQNLLNVVLYEAWLEGLMDRRVYGASTGGDGVTVGDLTLLVPSLAERAPSDAPVNFEIAPALPPVVTQVDGGLRIDAADVRADVVARVGGRDVHLMTVSIGATARVTPQVRDDELSASVGDVELTGVDVMGDAKDELPSGPDLEELLLAVLGDRLEEGMEIGGLETPSLYGFDIDAGEPTAEAGYVGLTGSVHYVD